MIRFYQIAIIMLCVANLFLIKADFNRSDEIRELNYKIDIKETDIKFLMEMEDFHHSRLNKLESKL